MAVHTREPSKLSVAVPDTLSPLEKEIANAKVASAESGGSQHGGGGSFDLDEILDKDAELEE